MPKQYTFTVKKFTRDAVPSAVEVECQKGLTYDAAVAAAIELGAVPGSGRVGSLASFRAFKVTADPVAFITVVEDEVES